MSNSDFKQSQLAVPVSPSQGGTGTNNGTNTLAIGAGASVSGTNTGDQTNITGNAATVTTNANLTGPVTSVGNATAIANGAITSAMLSTNVKLRDVTFSIDGQGSAITAGGTWYLSNVNYAGTITAWNIVADVSGSIVIDVWKTNAAIPTVANTITASSLPTLSSAQSAFVGSVSGWTTSISANDVFAFHINSASAVTKLSLTLQVTIT